MPTRPQPTWTTTVRYAEVDQQGVVFNAHYLTYCDEAMGAFCAQAGILDFAESVRLVTTTLTWSAAARWGDTVDVGAECTRVGTTSVWMRFEITAAGASCCTVETVYVHTDPSGAPAPLPDGVRAVLSAGPPAPPLG